MISDDCKKLFIVGEEKTHSVINSTCHPIVHPNHPRKSGTLEGCAGRMYVMVTCWKMTMVAVDGLDADAGGNFLVGGSFDSPQEARFSLS